MLLPNCGGLLAAIWATFLLKTLSWRRSHLISSLLHPRIQNIFRGVREDSNLISGEEGRFDKEFDIMELEKSVLINQETENEFDVVQDSLSDPLEKLNSAKRELAAKLRLVIMLKRRLDDVPTQSELIQFERRFSELDAQIQEKLRQTRKFYATYNALLEIKELVLKETSLLNSISSQFQDAMTCASGRVKLIESMKSIEKGIQQKLGKVELGLHAEKKVCDALKEKYAAAIAEQRHCSSHLKAFQEEYAKNKTLRSKTSM